MRKKNDNENTSSRSAENELEPPVMAIPPLENETHDFDPFFPLSQEMKWSVETENAPKGKDWTTITILQEEIREKDEEIENLNGLIKNIVGVIPKKFYG